MGDARCTANRKIKNHPRDGKTATSPCIGNNESLECLAEINIACELWAVFAKYSEEGELHLNLICATMDWESDPLPIT